MDLVPYLPWIVFLHIVAAFGFVLSHGVSAFVAFRVRGERDPARIAALLDLSASSIGVMYGSLLLVVVFGVLGAVVGGYFGRGWPWAAIVTLVVVSGAMYPLATSFYGRIRRALGQVQGDKATDGPATPLPPAELVALLDNRRPEAITAVGVIGLLVILWLMVLKPF